MRIKTALFSLVYQEINEILASWLIKKPNLNTHPIESISPQSCNSEVFGQKKAVTALYGLVFQEVHKIMVFNSESKR